MKRVRPPAVAGTFYPADPGRLSLQIARFLSEAVMVSSRPLALIAPHAGYIYSGPVAAAAYAALRERKDEISRIVLIGPSHRVGFDGLALPDCEAFSTPLGEIPVDQDGVNRIKNMPGVIVLDRAFENEHSLEVHLPFLQTVLDSFTLVPLAAGRADPERTADVLDALTDGRTAFVISTDLSHFLDYGSAKVKDAATARSIESLDDSRIGGTEACGCAGVSGLLRYARRREFKIRAVDLRNSGDTAGDKSRVVGYGAFLVEAS